MADYTRNKQQEIPFILNGQTIVKTVTKNTTCSDVINKLPSLCCPLAVFESVDGVEMELSGKTKLLKVWRTHGRSQERTANDSDRTCTVTSDRFKYLKEDQGKNIILQRFMNDQNIPASSFIGCDVATTSSVKRQRRVRYSMPVFSNQEEKCRFLWDLYCDSDSDSESETSERFGFHDISFHAEKTSNQETTLPARHRTLRRESADSNLNLFSLVSSDIGLDKSNDETSFDYSFDCSFPRMDESQFSLDLSYSFDDSESEAYDSDQSVDSFVSTKSFKT